MEPFIFQAEFRGNRKEPELATFKKTKLFLVILSLSGEQNTLKLKKWLPKKKKKKVRSGAWPVKQGFGGSSN